MSYLKERIKHAVRFRHKRGFGVHSPFMFNLILNVIRDKEKQFTYPEALDNGNILNQREKKVFRLLSRLIRYLKADEVVCVGKNADLLTAYLAIVYPKAHIQSNNPEVIQEADFVYFGRKASEILEGHIDFAETGGKYPKYIVIADIYKDTYNVRMWRQLKEKATVSVDMMWYGLLFFDTNIQKGKYNLII